MNLAPPRRVAIISEHASPLGVIGGVDGGGQNVYVAHVARQLAEAGRCVDVYTRRDRADLDEIVEFEGYRVIHVDAGPAEFVRKEDLLQYMPEFTESVCQFVAEHSSHYDIVPTHITQQIIAKRKTAKQEE